MGTSVSDQQLAKLSSHFAEHGAPKSGKDFAAAGAAADLDRRTARRAWESGIKGRPPLSGSLGTAQTLARATLTNSLRAEREAAPALAAADAAEQLAREASMSRAVSEAVHVLLRDFAPLYSQVSKLVAKLSADVDKLTRDEAMALLRFTLTVHKDLASTVDASMDIERRRLGAPQSVNLTKVEVTQVTATVEQTAHMVNLAQAAIERARARSLAGPIVEGNRDAGAESK